MPIQIADTACVDPSAELEDDVEIGPYSIVGSGVRLGRGTRIVGHGCLFGSVRLGAGCVMGPFAVLGRAIGPLSASPTGSIQIGERVQIASGVMVEPALDPNEPTRIDDEVVLGPHVHVGPSSAIGRAARLDSGAVLGAKVEVGEGSVVSPGVSVHPRVTIGAFSFVGGPTRVFHDVPPFMLADGHPAKIRGLHLVGLKRLGIDPAALRSLHEAHRLIYRGRLPVDTAAEQLAARGQATPQVTLLLDFLRRQRDGAHGRARDRAASLSEDRAA